MASPSWYFAYVSESDGQFSGWFFESRANMHFDDHFHVLSVNGFLLLQTLHTLQCTWSHLRYIYKLLIQIITWTPLQSLAGFLVCSRDHQNVANYANLRFPSRTTSQPAPWVMGSICRRLCAQSVTHRSPHWILPMLRSWDIPRVSRYLHLSLDCCLLLSIVRGMPGRGINIKTNI